MNDIAFKVIIKNDGIDDVIFKTIMLKGEKGDKGDAGGAEIDDTTTSSTKTWSSNKIRNEIDAKPDNLSELGDVDLNTITDGQMLGYNLSAGKWENKNATASSLKYDANTSIKDKIDEKANTADLAPVATSGEYNDLSNKPSIPPAQVNADWNASSGVAEILNKPTIPTNALQLPISESDSTNTKAYIDTEKLANTASYLYTPTVTEPTLSVGTNHNNRTWYYKHGTRVCLSIGVRDLSVGLLNQDIFNLPVGYRPRKPLSLICCGYSFDKHCAMMITDTGIVRVAYTQDQGAFGYVEFDAYS